MREKGEDVETSGLGVPQTWAPSSPVSLVNTPQLLLPHPIFSSLFKGKGPVSLNNKEDNPVPLLLIKKNETTKILTRDWNSKSNDPPSFLEGNPT